MGELSIQFSVEQNLRINRLNLILILTFLLRLMRQTQRKHRLRRWRVRWRRCQSWRWKTATEPWPSSDVSATPDRRFRPIREPWVESFEALRCWSCHAFRFPGRRWSRCSVDTPWWSEGRPGCRSWKKTQIL